MRIICLVCKGYLSARDHRAHIVQECSYAPTDYGGVAPAPEIQI